MMTAFLSCRAQSPRDRAPLLTTMVTNDKSDKLSADYKGIGAHELASTIDEDELQLVIHH